jgi:GTP-binding protein
METIYITSALKPEQLPEFELPEFAFIGRSNAGKSSLLNALVGRRQLAREGKMPGRTQMINFFSLNNKVILADMPGYGFRTVAKTTSKQWEVLVEVYLQRPNIAQAFFLIDCRREIDNDDIAVLRYFTFNASQKAVIVLTKCDKVSKSALKSLMDKMRTKLIQHRIETADMVGVSVQNRMGIDDLRKNYLAHFLEKPE